MLSSKWEIPVQVLYFCEHTKWHFTVARDTVLIVLILISVYVFPARRVTSIQYDVRMIEANAKVFNEPQSNIVRCACLITELLLRLIR